MHKLGSYAVTVQLTADHSVSLNTHNIMLQYLQRITVIIRSKMCVHWLYILQYDKTHVLDGHDIELLANRKHTGSIRVGHYVKLALSTD